MYRKSVNFGNKPDMFLGSVAENTYEQRQKIRKMIQRYNKPLKEKNSQSPEVFNSNYQKYNFGNDNYDVAGYKDNRHTGVWITIIIVLSVLCMCAGVFYTYAN